MLMPSGFCRFAQSSTSDIPAAQTEWSRMPCGEFEQWELGDLPDWYLRDVLSQCRPSAAGWADFPEWSYHLAWLGYDGLIRAILFEALRRQREGSL